MNAKPQRLQDPYLNALRRDRVPVSLDLVNGIRLQGRTDCFALCRPAEGAPVSAAWVVATQECFVV
jgi:hypothetical protein